MDGMEKVLEEIKKERERQESHWGTDFDDKNTLNDWVAYIMIKAGQAASMFSSPEKQRENLLKTAALAVAACEAFDRNNGFPERHYEDMVESDGEPDKE